MNQETKKFFIKAHNKNNNWIGQYLWHSSIIINKNKLAQRYTPTLVSLVFLLTSEHNSCIISEQNVASSQVAYSNYRQIEWFAFKETYIKHHSSTHRLIILSNTWNFKVSRWNVVITYKQEGWCPCARLLANKSEG